MVGVTVNRVNVLGRIHALLRCYTVHIIGTTYVFGCSGVVCALAGKVCEVVLQAMLKTAVLADLDPRGPYPLADSYPPPRIWTP